MLTLSEQYRTWSTERKQQYVAMLEQLQQHISKRNAKLFDITSSYTNADIWGVDDAQ